MSRFNRRIHALADSLPRPLLLDLVGEVFATRSNGRGNSVAIANAYPDVLAVIDEVTTNEDDGAVVALEPFLEGLHQLGGGGL